MHYYNTGCRNRRAEITKGHLEELERMAPMKCVYLMVTSSQTYSTHDTHAQRLREESERKEVEKGIAI